MKILQFLILFYFLQFVPIMGHAQGNEQQQRDSIERVVLKDSLQLTDSTITILFQIRTYFFSRTAELESDTLMSSMLKEVMAKQYATTTNQRIEQLLGAVKYEAYIAFIRRSMARMNLPPALTPLASTGQ